MQTQEEMNVLVPEKLAEIRKNHYSKMDCHVS